MNTSIADLLAVGRCQEAEWHMRNGAKGPLNLNELAEKLGTRLDPELFFVSPGYYAPLPSWKEAERCCGKAYEASSVIARYRQVARQELAQQASGRPIGPYAMRQLAAMQHAWISLERPTTLRVMDFGGALGKHFQNLNLYWPWSSLHWTVCETEAVSSAGKTEFEIENLRGHQLHFSNNVIEILDSGVDIVLASCSLQYIENWPQIIQQFGAAPWLLLDRVPLIDHPTDIIDIQVVPANYTDTRYPGWKFAKNSWLPRLIEAGFELVMQWQVPEDQWTVLDLKSGQYRWNAKHDYGFLFRQAITKSSIKSFITF